METLITYLQSLDPGWVYASVAGIAFVENVFPPFPSDVLVVAAGSLASGKHVDPVVTVIVATAGSTLGFAVMYKIGQWLGNSFLEKGRVKFIPPNQVRKVEGWFRKYGYTVVIVNRFLAGTRAVVSFFAGLSDLPLTLCLILSFVSALAWNALLVGAGFALGKNWRIILTYLESYGEAVTGLLIAGILAYLGFRAYRKRSVDLNSGEKDEPTDGNAL